MMQCDAERERQLAVTQLDDLEHHDLLHMEIKLLSAAHQWLWSPMRVLAAGHWSLEQSWMREAEGRARLARRDLDAAERQMRERLQSCVSTAGISGLTSALDTLHQSFNQCCECYIALHARQR